MFAWNEDNGAADRLESLNTSGLFADFRLKDRIAAQAEEREENIEQARDDLSDHSHVWLLPKMVDLTVRGTKSKTAPGTMGQGAHRTSKG